MNSARDVHPGKPQRHVCGAFEWELEVTRLPYACKEAAEGDEERLEAGDVEREKEWLEFARLLGFDMEGVR